MSRALLTVWFVVCAASQSIPSSITAPGDWYWDSPVNLHIDNHSRLVGKGKSADEIAALLQTLPVDIVQVSAYGADGATTTYPGKLFPRDDLEGWDTLAVWKEAARKAGKRFHVYINTRGLQVTKQHPDWVQRDAAGKGKGKSNGLDACARPSDDGTGYLESLLLPLIDEIMATYRPGGIWVDGDHARSRTCYCRHCKAAWQKLTGKAAPPVAADDPDWPRWLALEQDRYDEYRRRMADAVHRVDPSAFYTSNHSWKKATLVFERDDPRDAPDFADTVSADLSHGQALAITRTKAMFLSAETRKPWDIMNLVHKPGEISLQRVLQQGAVTLAHGGSWFLWVPGGDPLAPAVLERVRECAGFVHDRAAALGRSTSVNPVAVLVSETAWCEERTGGRAGFSDLPAAEHWALMLEDACFGVDLLNESGLDRDLRQYRAIVVPNQRSLAAETTKRLRAFAASGGKLILTGETAAKEFHGLDPVAIDCGKNGLPLPPVKPTGTGGVYLVAAPVPPVPDYDGFVPRLMEACGLGPSVRLPGAGNKEHLIFNFREKGGKTIVHVSDIGSRVNGVRKYEEITQLIDDAPPVPEITFQLATPEPASVSVVPSTSTMEHTWRDGLLTVTLRNLAVHAALIVDAAPAPPMALLPTGGPLEERHPLSHYPRPEGLEEDFEIASRGQEVKLAGPYELRSKGDTAIEISDETASSGKYALKFTDAPCDPSYMPMLCIKPPIGLPASLACDLKVGKGAILHLEFREQENRREFPVGPSLSFNGDTGRILAGRKDLGPFPVGAWFATTVVLPAAGGASYDLRIDLPGGNGTVHQQLPFENPKYAKFGWIGFTGSGNQTARFYIDNLKIRRATAGALKSK